MTRNLVVHFRRRTYLIVPTAEALALAGRRVIVHESADGRVEIRCGANILPYSVLDKQPLVPSGEVVENKRLGSVSAQIFVLVESAAGASRRSSATLRALSSANTASREFLRLASVRDSKAGLSVHCYVNPSAPLW